MNPTSTDSYNNNRRDSVPLRNNDEPTYRNPYNTRAPEIDLSTRQSFDREEELSSSTRRNQRTSTVKHQNNRNPSVRYLLNI